MALSEWCFLLQQKSWHWNESKQYISGFLFDLWSVWTPFATDLQRLLTIWPYDHLVGNSYVAIVDAEHEQMLFHMILQKKKFSAGTWMYLWPAHPYWEALFFFTIRCFFGYENRWLVCMPKCFFCRMCTRSKVAKLGWLMFKGSGLILDHLTLTWPCFGSML